MPIFKYRGYTADGGDVSGSVEATGLNDAVVKVRAEGILPSEIAETGIMARKGLLRRSNEAFLPTVTRQLSVLLSSGVPLIEALQSLSDESKGFFGGILIAVRERVSQGASLSRAMEDFSGIFPDFYVNMIRSGEESGTLDKVLLRLADFLEGRSAVRSKVRSAMIYPLLMIGVSMVVLSFLFTFVIPKIVKIFSDTKAALPVLTRALIFISNIFTGYWWLIICIAIAAVLFVRRFRATHGLLIDRMVLKSPGNIVQSLYYSRFARTLGFLLEGGLPMLRALNLSARSIGNRQLEAAVLNSERRVAEGQSLSSTLEGFPPVFVQLISTGEKSGRLSEVLIRAAQAYEEEFDRKVNRAVSLFEPAMILVMGLVVLFIVLAVLLPMFQLNQLIK